MTWLAEVVAGAVVLIVGGIVAMRIPWEIKNAAEDNGGRNKGEEQ